MFWESSHYYINDVIPYRQEVAFEYFVFFSPQNDLRLLFPSVSDVSRRPGYTTTRRLRRTRSWEKGWITSSDQKQRNATSRESSHGASDVEKHLVVVFVVLSDIFSCLKEREMMRNSRWGIQNKVKQILASDVLQFTHSGSCVLYTLTRFGRKVKHVDTEELGPNFSSHVVRQQASLADSCTPQGLDVHGVTVQRLLDVYKLLLLPRHAIWRRKKEIWTEWLKVTSNRTGQSSNFSYAQVMFV